MAGGLFLSVYLVGNCQFLAAFSTAGSQHSAAVLCLHAVAEPMFVISLSVVGLKCSFHFLMLVFLFCLFLSASRASLRGSPIKIWVAKLRFLFVKPKYTEPFLLFCKSFSLFLYEGCVIEVIDFHCFPYFV